MTEILENFKYCQKCKQISNVTEILENVENCQKLIKTFKKCKQI